jgi:hypothetical protein
MKHVMHEAKPSVGGCTTAATDRGAERGLGCERIGTYASYSMTLVRRSMVCKGQGVVWAAGPLLQQTGAQSRDWEVHFFDASASLHLEFWGLGFMQTCISMTQHIMQEAKPVT